MTGLHTGHGFVSTLFRTSYAHQGHGCTAHSSFPPSSGALRSTLVSDPSSASYGHDISCKEPASWSGPRRVSGHLCEERYDPRPLRERPFLLTNTLHTKDGPVGTSSPHVSNVCCNHACLLTCSLHGAEPYALRSTSDPLAPVPDIPGACKEPLVYLALHTSLNLNASLWSIQKASRISPTGLCLLSMLLLYHE